MTDLLLQIAVSNVCIALVLAILAVIVESTAKRPALAHLLWLLVFVKLLTPPMVTIPIITMPGTTVSVTAAIPSDLLGSAPQIARSEFDVFLAEKMRPAVLEQFKTVLLLTWFLGSGSVLIWSLARVYRFNRLLRIESKVAPHALQTTAMKIAIRLGLKSIPIIATTSARIYPLVWWIGGKVRIVIPRALLDHMDTKQSQWILAHELAHVRRRDHLVRWLEWLACVCFWWNPLVWWGRHRLRANEELCCDDLVISSLKPKPHAYANSLLDAIEHLTAPALYPPAIASQINSGGFLERRIKMIISETQERSGSRWLRACALLCATVVLPFGIACAQDYDAVGKRLRKAVEAKELTREQARTMLATLRKSAGAKEAQDWDWPKAKLMRMSKELDAAVEVGEISREDADKRYEAAAKAIQHKLASAHGDRGTKGISREDYAAAEIKLRQLVTEGEVSEEDAKIRLRTMRRMVADHTDRRGHHSRWEGIKRRIEGAVERGDLTREQADARYRAIKARMASARTGGKQRITREEMGKVKKRIWAGVEEGKLTEAQAKERWEGYLKRVRGETQKEPTNKKSKRDEGLAIYYEKLGVSGEKLTRIKKILADHGFKPKQMAGAFGGMIRVMHEMKSEGDDFELNPRMQEYFEETVGLTDEQIKLIKRLSRRLLHGLRESDR